MHRHPCKDTWIKKTQENMTLSKENNKAPVNKPKEMESYNFPEKAFKMIILKKPNEMQEKNNPDRQFNKIRKNNA